MPFASANPTETKRPEGDTMNLVERVKGILLSPREEWPKIPAETETTQSLYTGYIMILAAIGPLALLIRSLAMGRFIEILTCIIAYGVGLGATYVMALIVDWLAPTFGGEKNFIQSLKLVAYSYTAAWVAGIFHLMPGIGGVIGLIASIYSFYTFYLGVPTMKKCPPEKAVGYTVVVVICGIVLGGVLFNVLLSVIVGGSVMRMMGAGML